MKAYTDISQSRKLTEILPLESADMAYFLNGKNELLYPTPFIINDKDGYYTRIYCWSLAALLDVLPNSHGRYTKSLYWFDDDWHCEYVDEDGEGVFGTSANNSLDACVEMILELNEQKLL